MARLLWVYELIHEYTDNEYLYRVANSENNGASRQEEEQLLFQVQLLEEGLQNNKALEPKFAAKKSA